MPDGSTPWLRANATACLRGGGRDRSAPAIPEPSCRRSPRARRRARRALLRSQRERDVPSSPHPVPGRRAARADLSSAVDPGQTAGPVGPCRQARRPSRATPCDRRGLGSGRALAARSRGTCASWRSGSDCLESARPQIRDEGDQERQHEDPRGDRGGHDVVRVPRPQQQVPGEERIDREMPDQGVSTLKRIIRTPIRHPAIPTSSPRM